jgi:hypothetical protein
VEFDIKKGGNKNMLNIALTNLGKYNEGELVFEWLELPASDEEIQETFKKIGVAEGSRYEEYFISDFETDIDGLDVGEYENLEELNELAERIDNLDTEELEIFQALMESVSSNIGNALDNVDNYYLMNDIKDDYDLGKYWIEESGCYEVPDNLKYYIDYEKFGRDIAMESDGYMTSYGWLQSA